jgi:hypothetical protein
VNPVGGLDGFWVGNNKLGSLMGFGMVTPSQTGEWQFSGSGYDPNSTYRLSEGEESGSFIYALYIDNQAPSIVESQERLMSVVFEVDGVTATRAYPLQNRSINSLVCPAATTNFLQFPPAIDNMARDFYVRLTLETNSSSVGVAKFDTLVSYETADGNWPNFSTGGTYIVRMTETGKNSGKWNYSNVPSGYMIDENGNYSTDQGEWIFYITGGSGEYAQGGDYNIGGNGTETTLTLSFDGYTVTATRRAVFLLNSQPAKQATQP